MKAYALPHDFPNLDQERQMLASVGVELTEIEATDPQDIARVAGDAVALFVQYTKITEETLSRLPQCKVILRYGIGVDNVDLEAAARYGIWVCNVPFYCINEVADHAFSFLLAAARKLIPSNRSVHEGKWDFLDYRPIQCLAGKTLGLAGFGRIARQVAKRAQAFDMHVIAYDPWAPAGAFDSAGVRSADLDELFGESDFLSLHVPLTDGTKHLINERSLAKMKDGVVIVNTARGGLIHTEDAANGIETGKIGALCVDVLEQEPPDGSHPWIGLEQVLITPHSAYYSEESLPRLQRQAAEEVLRVLGGERPASPANAKWMPETP
ncbi:C-terminal binding protein [Paenibacillus sp.]|uniref:C-terminal binding protein n=1 Tax=Paenibacillus sp. TaxID=58172 RepID=UPI002D59A8CC|nr:C-terminal binding protein [Paenibacillus sp.]HZG55540.1 C-terminal binding protein [Paenibacillus sp.]